jgi:putative transposase
VRLLAFCLMPNHFHLALWPIGDHEVSSFMHWLLTTHAARYQKCSRRTGHVWQGRFKTAPFKMRQTVLGIGSRERLTPL